MRKDGAVRAVLSCLVLPAFLGSCSGVKAFQLWKEGLGSPEPPCLFLFKRFSCPYSSYIQLPWTGPSTEAN